MSVEVGRQGALRKANEVIAYFKQSILISVWKWEMETRD